MGERRGMKALEAWCRRLTEGYRDVNITNMTSSWRDGLAFCAIIHHFRPDLIDFDSLSKEQIYYNNHLAFSVAQEKLGIPALLDAEDMVKLEVPDRLSILTYVSQLYQYFSSPSGSDIKPHKRYYVCDSPTISPEEGSEKQKSMAMAVSNPQYDRCNACGNKVYLLERLIVGSRLFHRSCFRCSDCRALLVPGSYLEDGTGKFTCQHCPGLEPVQQAPSTKRPLEPAKSPVRKTPPPPPEKPPRLVALSLQRPPSPTPPKPKVANLSSPKHSTDAIDAILPPLDRIDSKRSNSFDYGTPCFSRARSSSAPEAADFVQTTNKMRHSRSFPDQGIVGLNPFGEESTVFEHPIPFEDDFTLPKTFNLTPSREQRRSLTSSELDEEPRMRVQAPRERRRSLTSSELDEEQRTRVQAPKERRRSSEPAQEDIEKVVVRALTPEPRVQPSRERRLSEPVEEDVEIIIRPTVPARRHSATMTVEEKGIQSERRPPLPRPRTTIVTPEKKKNEPLNPFEDDEQEATLNPFSEDDDSVPVLEGHAFRGRVEGPPTANTVRRSPLLIAFGLVPDPNKPELTLPATPTRTARKKRLAPTPPQLETPPLGPSPLLPKRTTSPQPIPMPRKRGGFEEPCEKSQKQMDNLLLKNKQQLSPETETPEVKIEAPTTIPNATATTPEVTSQTAEQSRTEETVAPPPKTVIAVPDSLRVIEIDSDSKSDSGSIVRRKKKPAPNAPVPPRRHVIKIPLKEIEKELAEIEAKHIRLEKAGVVLETKIRNEFEGAEQVEDSRQEEQLILQLFELVNQKNILFRRQAELIYQKRQQRLEEEHAELEYQIRTLMNKAESQKSLVERLKEEELIRRLVDVVQERNEIVESMELDRIRGELEDHSIREQLALHDKLSTLSLSQQSASAPCTPVKKKEKRKKRKEKHRRKVMEDEDKDLDEIEVAEKTKSKDRKIYKFW